MEGSEKIMIQNIEGSEKIITNIVSAFGMSGLETRLKQMSTFVKFPSLKFVFPKRFCQLLDAVMFARHRFISDRCDQEYLSSVIYVLHNCRNERRSGLCIKL